MARATNTENMIHRWGTSRKKVSFQFNFEIVQRETRVAQMHWKCIPGSRLKPTCTCDATVTSQVQRSTNEGVLIPRSEPTIGLCSHPNIGLHTGARANVVLLWYSNSACSMLMSDDLSAAETRNRTPALRVPRHRLYL